jgi:hypothetical protein
MLQRVKTKSKEEKQIDETITLKTIQSLQIETCPVFGCALQYGGGDSCNESATIDALDYSKGHRKGNLRIISRKANTIKNSSTCEEMKQLIDALKLWKPPYIVIPKQPKKKKVVLSKEQTSKVCSQCHIEKPLNEFSKETSTSLGVRSNCFRCSAFKAMCSNSKKRAETKKKPFQISRQYLMELAKDIVYCPILGIPLQYANGKLCDASASLDRFYPNKGYVPGNVWIISDKANRMKSDASIEEIEKVYNYMVSG